MKILTIYKRELKSYFLSPLAYVLVGFLLLISGYFFATFVLSTQYALMSPVLATWFCLHVYKPNFDDEIDIRRNEKWN
jgi:hypothetical protein